MSQSRGLISGIHSQSDDILAQIFVEHAKWADEDILHPNDGPWVPSRVCRSWRRIAIAHPKLWCIIRVEEPDPDFMCDSYLGDSDSDSGDESDENPSRMALHLLKLALERSRDSPLEVSLNFDMGDDEEMAAEVRRMGLKDSSTTQLPHMLIRAVVAHSNRWKTADLHIKNSLLHLLTPIRNRLSMLTELTISSFGDSPRPFPFADNAPRLTDVTLNGYPHELVPLQWSSIRHFSELMYGRRASTINPTERCLKMLRKNLQLESLKAYTSPAAVSSTSVLTHRSLRCLASSDPNLIRCLTLPKFEEFIVAPIDGTVPAIRALFERSKCTLRSLSLSAFTLDTDLLVLLSSSTGLKKPTVNLTGWSTQVKETMDLLVRKLAEHSFLPSLENLDIVISQDYPSVPQ
ncbi:hypothetical protein DFH06DRAFT_1211634 [Mycena polygramma]|nr:hypothetical protein DFH06DRAFT_1211634 [Mycena polygramma]